MNAMNSEVTTSVSLLVRRPAEEVFDAVEDPDGTSVSWRFVEHESGGTVVEIASAGFTGGPDEVVEAALGATEGFTIVLCDLKTYLESGVSARLSHDKAVLIAAGQNAR